MPQRGVDLRGCSIWRAVKLSTAASPVGGKEFSGRGVDGVDYRLIWRKLWNERPEPLLPSLLNHGEQGLRKEAIRVRERDVPDGALPMQKGRKLG